MEIEVIAGAIQEQPSDLIVVNLFQGITEPGGATGAVNRALDGALSERIADGDFDGKFGQLLWLYPRKAIPARRVLVVGLGQRDDFDLEKLRQVMGIAARAIQDVGVTRYASIVHGAGAGGLEIEEAAHAVVEGAILGSYQFEGYRSKSRDERPPLEQLTLVEFNDDSIAAVRRGAEAGRVIAQAACFARDLVNQPGNHLTPDVLAQTAQEMAATTGLDCQVLDEDDMAELGMNALLAVAQGSREPARFIVLQHNANRQDLAPHVVIGKGITFDSGGISIKPSEGMQRMKYDMAGAAATLAVLRAVAELDLPLRVIGLVPATENMPGGRALKPGDVLHALSGLSIEIISTDAEGRLILADALAYAERFEPQAVVDLATLTGGCVVALGHVAAGLMGNDQALLDAVLEASRGAGEIAWQLPMFDAYDDQIKSDVADIKNSGGREASSITAAKFLGRFAESYPWSHLDIAGTAWADETKGYTVKGATGYGVLLLTAWLRQVSSRAID